MSLEYKLSNINQAKAFAKYLNEIGAFYTNRNVDFPMLESFTVDELKKIGPLEHKRWLEEHYEMGWEYISKKKLETIVMKETVITETDSKDSAAFKAAVKAAVKNKRDLLRKHWDMIPEYCYTGEEIPMKAVEKNYNRLTRDDKNKDTEPMNHMVGLLKEFDGLRIYRYAD